MTSGTVARLTVDAEGETTVVFQVRDQTGSEIARRLVTVKIDRTPPTVSAGRATPANEHGWSNRDVVVTFAAADALSGIPRSPESVTLSTEGADQTATGTAADRAGNTGSATLAGIHVDKTPPVISYTGNHTVYTVDETIRIGCVVTDALSGVATHDGRAVEGPAYALPLGESRFSATATDRAGNVGLGVTAFTVRVTLDSLGALTRRFVTDAKTADALRAMLNME